MAKKPRTLTHQQVAALAESVGLPGETFAQIAKGESGYQVGAVGNDPGGTPGYGLWQITTHWNDDIIKRFGGREKLLTDPVANAKAAKAIYDRQGIKAWYGTRYMTGTNLHYKGDTSAWQNAVESDDGSTATAEPTVRTVSNQAERAQLVSNWLMARKTGDSRQALMAMAMLPREKTVLGSKMPTQPATKKQVPSGTPGSTPSRDGMSRLLELFWEGKGAIDYSKGTMLADGAIGNHSDHVHVAAGKNTTIKLGKIAEQMGLAVRENPHWDPVDPVHVPNSYHYRNQAIDVSGDAELMRKYAAKVAHIYGLKVN